MLPAPPSLRSRSAREAARGACRRMPCVRRKDARRSKRPRSVRASRAAAPQAAACCATPRCCCRCARHKDIARQIYKRGCSACCTKMSYAAISLRAMLMISRAAATSRGVYAPAGGVCGSHMSRVTMMRVICFYARCAACLREPYARAQMSAPRCFYASFIYFSFTL